MDNRDHNNYLFDDKIMAIASILILIVTSIAIIIAWITKDPNNKKTFTLVIKAGKTEVLTMTITGDLSDSIIINNKKYEIERDKTNGKITIDVLNHCNDILQ